MAFRDDIETQVKATLNESWDIRDGRTIPDATTVALKGGAVRMPACILFCDLVASSQLTEQIQKRTAAKVYKAFLGAASRIASANGGTITAFDGDRMMAAFAGDAMCTQAVRTALGITWAMENIVKPNLKNHFVSLENPGFAIRHCTGVDAGEVFVVKAGMHGANDLVWVGRATNLAARLSEVRDKHQTNITAEVYTRLPEDLKKTNGQDMWEGFDIEFAGAKQRCGTSNWMRSI